MMASNQLGYMEQDSSDDEQNSNISNNEESDRELEDNSKDDQTQDEFYMSEHFLSTHNTGMPLAVEQNPNIIKTDESDRELEDNMDEADKEAFLSDSDSNEDMDINYVVGASAETLYKLTHTHDTHTGRKRVNYSCNVCEKDFKDKRICIRHIRVHTGEKPFQCYQCGESFGREDYLRSHIASHIGEKPFSCPRCNKDFAKKSTLDQHLLTHTDMSERPYPCNQCDSGFIKKSHLERHLKTHTGIREFVCSVCGKDFLEKRRMLDHMKRLHSDRVLPSCTRCKREFRWDHLLRRHIKAHIENPCMEASEEKEQLLQMFTNIVKKDEKYIPANTQNPSNETSDSHSLFGNALGVNDGPGIINNDAVSQNSDTVKTGTLENANFTKEELSILNPQFFPSSINDIEKTDTQCNNLGGILEKSQS